MDDCYCSMDANNDNSGVDLTLVDSYAPRDGTEDENEFHLQDDTIGMSSGDLQVVATKDKDVLVGLTATSKQDAFFMYNDYAKEDRFRSNGKQYYRQTTKGVKSINIILYLCSNTGVKKDTNKNNKLHSNVNVCTDCQARIKFNADENGIWRVTKHEKSHNYSLCHDSQRQFLRSQRVMTKKMVKYLHDMKASRIPFVYDNRRS
ncbi:OLC1v1012707C1 [Oldenlandia corymbosa var. corymbosa]|uniref:OLC1v1012707C1 n=1 Tax=Oldenlandia corymbosa var. corymbosa TaxID=529605 RepID=A0AAV1DZK1_OLDCO|nr:OLC1v1012707C1 [Oldenlandia corymbosa var. corymbosa]